MTEEIYHRKLPHLQPAGGTFFVTYRLAGTIPVSIRMQLKEEYEAELIRLQKEGKTANNDKLARYYFDQYDDVLAQCHNGTTYLRQPNIAQIVVDSLLYWDGKRIGLIAYCVMPNHVHVVLTLLNNDLVEKPAKSLNAVMQSIKSFSARKANSELNLAGKFWEEESYDRLVRNNDELIRIVRYVLQNPVKAGLCQQWQDWPWRYVKAEYDMF